MVKRRDYKKELSRVKCNGEGEREMRRGEQK